MKRWILTAAIMAAACGTGDGSADANYTIYGQGTQSCGTWTKDTGLAKSIDQAWVLGFLSGAGWMRHTMRDTDRDGVMAAMDTRCEQFPTENIAEAAAATATLLKNK